MAAPTTIDEALLKNALGPKSSTNSDGQSATAQSAADLIALANAIEGRALKTDPLAALHQKQIKPPGGSR